MPLTTQADQNIPLILFPLFSSRFTNFNASSTAQRMFVKLERSIFSLLQVTACFIEIDIAQHHAPAAFAAKQMPPPGVGK